MLAWSLRFGAGLSLCVVVGCSGASERPGAQAIGSSDTRGVVRETGGTKTSVEVAPNTAASPAGTVATATAAGAAGGEAAASDGRAEVRTSPAVDSTATSVVARYPGSGFVVHEWGTNTVVVGSDGSLQRGLHHEGDDLPSFVYDRLKQAETLRFPSVDKMETPVDYFYSDTPRTVSVRVDMPLGVPTQWYPAVREFSPPVLTPVSGSAGLVDPVNDAHMALSTQQCIDKYTKFSSGSLQWGTVKVLGPGELPSIALPAAPLEQFTWSYARQVAANALLVDTPGFALDGSEIKAAQAEQFLFYRGLGNYDSPLRVTAAADPQRLTLNKPVAWQSGAPAFVMRVTESQGAFMRVDRLPDSGSAEVGLPDAQALLPLDAFIAQLSQEVTRALRGTGLYDDEATAMVNTWRTQWFGTPGVRVLYVAPNSWLDQTVKLTITPAPDALVRVVVMRVEVITPELEARDVEAARMLDAGRSAQGRAYFEALGRFGEPRLRRALSVMGTAAGGQQAQALLAEIERPQLSSALGE